MEQAFDEWMRRYLENPEEFAREFESVAASRKRSRILNCSEYGEQCAVYLRLLMCRKTKRPKPRKLPRVPGAYGRAR